MGTKKGILVLSVVCLVWTLISCAGANRQVNGTAIGSATGAGIGAILGQAIEGDTEGTLIGAGIGAIIGGIAGNQMGGYMDRQEQDLRQAVAVSEAASIQRTNAAVAAAESAGIRRTQEALIATFRSDILFDFNSAMLKPGAYVELARVAEVLKKYPLSAIRVEGHTDAQGAERYNHDLSQRRAEAVKGALVQLGVDPARIAAVGYGESQPVSSSDAMNRRVTIVITPTSGAVG
ncbi:MAG: OmpA family protein [Deltaproteobacteria bacterium]|nr:OmpA family protein [Deltaproteobacteria bacterium]